MIYSSVHGSKWGSARGFTLIEVITALALVSVALLPMMSLFLAAYERLLAVGEEEGGAEDETAARGSQSSWEWSPSYVEEATWESGGLRLLIRVPVSEPTLEVGWWVDGWFGGAEVVPASQGGRVLLPQLRIIPEAAEVVVRVRVGDGPWGVPWRTRLSGETAPGDAGPRDTYGEPGEGSGVAAVVVHAPGAGVPSLTVTPPPEGPGILWPVVVPVDPGAVEVGCDGRTQRLEVGPDEVVHLYF